MFRKIAEEIGKIFVSPVLYIVLLALGGTFFVCYGAFLLVGEGAASIILGIMMLGCLMTISRSASGG